ncbi:MAG: hypothetical protein QW803_00745 [Candidatus Methanomethylicia archaeon]
MSYYVCPNCGMKMKSYWKLRKHIMEERSKSEKVSKDMQQIPAIVKQK